MPEPSAAAPPWWLLPNVVAADAPVVAVVWQLFLARRFGVAVPWAATLALAAAVWGIYLADRRLDASRGCAATDRHRAAARFPRLFPIGAVFAACVAGLAAARLPTGYLLYGGCVAAGVVAYLAAVHLAAGHLGGAKEPLVAVGFAAGVVAPLAAADGPPDAWLPSVAAFAGVCWLNCRLIDLWESAPRPPWVEAFLAAALLLGSAGLPAVGGSVAAACVGLLAVHATCRHRPRVARALADAVLLAPLAFWAVP